MKVKNHILDIIWEILNFISFNRKFWKYPKFSWGEHPLSLLPLKINSTNFLTSKLINIYFSVARRIQIAIEINCNNIYKSWSNKIWVKLRPMEQILENKMRFEFQSNLFTTLIIRKGTILIENVVNKKTHLSAESFTAQSTSSEWW